MKANELRIGNLIHRDGELVRVIKIDIDGCITETVDSLPLNGGIPQNLTGIPLTEEWLVKFGFVLSTPNEYIKNQHWYHEDSDIEFSYKLDCSIYEGNGHISATHIKHVHQLQNLYFALTGEELTIKQ